MKLDLVKDAPVQKNNRGTLGPVCNYCGGYGFTNVMNDHNGGSAGCPRCHGTGIEPIDVGRLQEQVNMLQGNVNTILLELQGLKNIIVKEAKRRI